MYFYLHLLSPITLLIITNLAILSINDYLSLSNRPPRSSFVRGLINNIHWINSRCPLTLYFYPYFGWFLCICVFVYLCICICILSVFVSVLNKNTQWKNSRWRPHPSPPPLVFTCLQFVFIESTTDSTRQYTALHRLFIWICICICRAK